MVTPITKSPPSVQKGILLMSFGFATYSAVVIWLSRSGTFAAIDTNIFAATIVAATVSLTLSYFLIPSIRMLAERLGPYGLAGFHIWRIPAGLTFLYYGWQGWLPDTFVHLAGWGDLLAGILAATIFMLPRSARTIAGFHIIGFIDFVIAVGAGITLNALAPQSMIHVTELPVSLIPLIGVPLSGATHIAAMHMIATRRNTLILD